MNAPRTAFATRSGWASAPSPAEGRRAWLVFLASAKARAICAVAGRPAPEDEATALGHLVTRLKASFPVRSGCALDVAAAALRLAAALATSARQQDRCAVGLMLIAAVDFLDRILTEDIEGAASLTRRISGAGED